jgi:hypothetical protein
MSRVIVHRSEWFHSSQSKTKTQAEEASGQWPVVVSSQFSVVGCQWAFVVAVAGNSFNTDH